MPSVYDLTYEKSLTHVEYKNKQMRFSIAPQIPQLFSWPTSSDFEYLNKS